MCADVPGLCERLRALAGEHDSKLFVCELGTLVGPDIGTVGALARLHLTARQLGCRITFRHASRELQTLLAFAGLNEVVRCVLLGCEGEAEEREQRLGVEERVQRDDLALRQLEHLERPRLEPAARPAGPILPERGRPVGDGRDQP
jgi:STAS domain